MFTARTKIVKPKEKNPSEFEQSVAQAIFDLESTSDDQAFKKQLNLLHIVAAKEITVEGGQRAIVIFVPFRMLNAYKRIQVRLVRELEKKFSKSVVIIGQRRVLAKPTRNNRVKRQKRPRSRTLTAVHDAILDDVCYPTEIVGRRIRYRLDGSKLQKVYLNGKDRANSESKLSTFASVYKHLTGQETVFEYPVA